MPIYLVPHEPPGNEKRETRREVLRHVNNVLLAISTQKLPSSKSASQLRIQLPNNKSAAAMMIIIYGSQLASIIYNNMYIFTFGTDRYDIYDIMHVRVLRAF